jgi:hypothetical protein
MMVNLQERKGLDVCEIRNMGIKERRLGQKMNCAPTQRVTNHRTSDLGSMAVWPKTS